MNAVINCWARGLSTIKRNPTLNTVKEDAILTTWLWNNETLLGVNFPVHWQSKIVHLCLVSSRFHIFGRESIIMNIKQLMRLKLPAFMYLWKLDNNDKTNIPPKLYLDCVSRSQKSGDSSKYTMSFLVGAIWLDSIVTKLYLFRCVLLALFPINTYIHITQIQSEKSHDKLI